MRLFIGLFLLTLSVNVIAGTHLIITLTSKHGEDTYTSTDGVETEYNNKNFGLGVAYDINNNVQARAGFYDNSYYKTSLYAGGSLHTDIRKTFAIGVQVAFVTGYDDLGIDKYDQKLLLIPLPFVKFGYKHMGFEIGYMPNLIKDTPLFTFQATIKL